MKATRYILTIAAILFAQAVSAQFYVTGDDPGKAKWYSIETDNFEVIYPEGADSLAKIYAGKIETFRVPVSLTSGYISGQGDGRKMPVVMHAYNAANGSVAWAPKRMDLFSIPSAYDPEPIPWTTMLSVHESRHITQMQFGMTKALKPGNWIFGEMWNILASLLYPGISTIEGDAVITETAWTPSGRGRTADFLNYYWVAFDNGDFRKWDKWRFVSQKYNAPNYYSLGYLTIGGFRYLYDCPDYMSEGFHLAAKKPYNLGAFYTTARKLTGKKFDDAFLEVCDTLYKIWDADAEKRKPYIVSEPVSPEKRMYTDYTDNMFIGNELYAIKKGHVNVPTLVRIDSTGKEHRVSTYAYSASGPQWSPELDRLYWSETVPDARWNLQSKSKIRYIKGGKGRIHTLRNPGMLHNPAHSKAHIATVRYEMGGKSFLDIIDGLNGESAGSAAAPDSLQLVEVAWIDDEIYATAISDNGYGIYSVSVDGNMNADGDWKKVLSPQPVKIKDFNAHGELLLFTCDRTGVNELYEFNPADGALIQKTSTRYGSESFCYSEDGRWLYYSSQTLKGKRIFRTPVDSLLDRKVSLADRYLYPIAEKVTAQEKAAAMKRGMDENINRTARDIKDVKVSEPKRYRKFPHMFNLHSWAPFYVNVNNIMNMNFENFWQAASLGAAGIMQSRLSTTTAEFGYSAHKDPYNNAHWRHSGHARITYSGLYPVIEASVDINDRGARQYSAAAFMYEDGRQMMSVSSRELQSPYIEGRLSIHIPFSFSKGGWFKGITPRISYKIGNDMFNTGIAVMQMEEHTDPETGTSSEQPVFTGETSGKNMFRHSLRGSLNAYVIQNTPSSAVYPRWGIGAEIGVSGNFESADFFSPMGYVYAYGYLPGIIREQGIRLSVMNQIQLDNKSVFGQPLVSTLPRGLSENATLTTWLSVRNPLITGIAADYAIPVFIGDLALGGTMFSIKRLILTPHFDMSFFKGGDLWSVGCDLDLDLHSILTLEVPCSFGVTFSYNDGSAFKQLATTPGLSLERFYVGPKFNVVF